MWCPFPLLLPYHDELTDPNTRPADMPRVYACMPHHGYAGMVPLQVVPFDHPMFQNTMTQSPGPHPLLSIEDGKKFLLNRSVYDLVNRSQSLELTDPQLLGWYLSLSPEDRKIIQDEGGFFKFLKRHPALEMTRQLVYVKYGVRGNFLPQQTMSSNLNKSRGPTFYGVTTCVTCGTSCSSGAKKCRRCNTPIQNITSTDQEREYDMLPNNVREELEMVDHFGGYNNTDGGGCLGAIGQQVEDEHPIDQLPNVEDSFQTACNSSHLAEDPTEQQGAHKSKAKPMSTLWEEGTASQRDSSSSSSLAVYKDSSPHASFSLDMELERQSQEVKPMLVSQSHMIQDQSGSPGYYETSQLHSNYSALQQETPPEFYSLSSTQMDRTEWNDTSISQSVEPECDSSMMATKGSLEQPSTGETPHGPAEGNSVVSSCTEDSHDDCLFSPPVNQYFHSIMAEDKGILMGKTGERLNPSASEVHSGTASQSAMTSSETLKANPSAVKMTEVRTSPAERSTSPVLPVASVDVSVGTELSLVECHEAATQTQSPATTDKHVITQVHMTDLDYLAEEFIRLKSAQEELKELKEKMASSGGVAKEGSCCVDGGCDCAQRAMQAELSLLALQYSMCQQHCWRRYYTSPVGDCLAQGPELPPANLASVLQTLKADYKEMRGKILAGIHLDQLTPLSVDSQRITTEARYIPAQLIGDTLGNVSSGSTRQLQRRDTGLGDRNGVPHGGNDVGSQDVLRRRDAAPQPKVDGNKPGGAPSPFPKQAGTSCRHRLGEKQTGFCKELNSSEAWYDAEEDLESAGPAAAAEMKGVSSTTPAMEQKDGSAKEVEKAKSSFLLVTDLPSNVTEDDVMLWFEKYHTSEVSISTFSNDIRVAMVTVSGLQSAEAAVREMNGCSMQGHDLHVEHLQRPRAGSRSQGLAKQQVSTHKPGPSGDAPKPQSSKTISSTVKLAPQQLLHSRLVQRKVVCDSPTATGICVPQHYATMGSFDTLMARLTERHPEVGRQRIVDSLLELRATHQGVLSGLPLKTIVEMTSELLTRPTSITPL